MIVTQIDERHTYDQGMVHNHALLALWQRNAWLFVTDLDELFATPVPATVQSLLAPGGCLAATKAQLLLVCMACPVLQCVYLFLLNSLLVVLPQIQHMQHATPTACRV